MKAYYSGGLPISLGYDTNGQYITQLQQGPDFDSNKMYFYVQVFDNYGGISVYNISSFATITSNNDFLTQNLNDIISGSVGSPVNSILLSGNTQKTLQTINSISSMLTSQMYCNLNSQNCIYF
jgi:hypothetical protein